MCGFHRAETSFIPTSPAIPANRTHAPDAAWPKDAVWTAGPSGRYGGTIPRAHGHFAIGHEAQATKASKGQLVPRSSLIILRMPAMSRKL